MSQSGLKKICNRHKRLLIIWLQQISKFTMFSTPCFLFSQQKCSSYIPLVISYKCLLFRFAVFNRGSLTIQQVFFSQNKKVVVRNMCALSEWLWSEYECGFNFKEHSPPRILKSDWLIGKHLAKRELRSTNRCRRLKVLSESFSSSWLSFSTSSWISFRIAAKSNNC